MNIGANNLGIVDSPPVVLANIVNLKERAIPLLIEHLDDVRPSSTIFHCGGPAQRVPIGYVCYDILISIVKDTAHQILIPDCEDDGLCACAHHGYCFRPDDYIMDHGFFKVKPIVAIVKLNFKQAYKKNRFSYVCPTWWAKSKIKK